jgi:hypothetical protein
MIRTFLRSTAALAFAAGLSTANTVPALASWYCPYWSSYYPNVPTCPFWRWDPNGPAEQEAAHRAQVAAIEAAHREEERKQAEQAKREAEQARHEAEQARREAEVRVVAENSPDNVCRHPELARILIEHYKTFNWPVYDMRTAIDVEHIVTMSDNPLRCHGTWLLTDGRRFEGTFTMRRNAAGDLIGTWVQEAWHPPVPASLHPRTPPTLTRDEVLPAVSTPTSSAFDDGVRDRQAWEDWFTGLSGDEREGALYWASQRSLPKPGSCTSLSPAQGAGCREAQARLSPSDSRRKTEPDYRAGWNSIHES